MKKFVFVLNLILISSVFSFAQRQKTSPDSEESPRLNQAQNARQKNRKNSDASKSDAASLAAGTLLEAQLKETLDVKSARVGDEVVLTTTKTIKAGGRTVVEKGARLVGRVTEVEQKSKNNAQSKLGVVFDKLEGKTLNAPLSATIVSVTQATAGAGIDDTLSTDIASGSTASGGVQRSGGGLLGGVTNTVGGVLNTTTNTVGGVANTATGTATGATQTLGGALSGIRLSQSTDATAGGATTLSSANRNIRLEKGATFHLRLNQTIEN